MNYEDREILVGESRFYLDEDDIMYVETSGNYDLKEALELRDAFLKLLYIVDGRVNIIVDNSGGEKPTQEARKVFADMMAHERCGKIAVIGLNPVARVIASFVLGSSKNKDTKIFKTKEKALAWLKGDKL